MITFEMLDHLRTLWSTVEPHLYSISSSELDTLDIVLDTGEVYKFIKLDDVHFCIDKIEELDTPVM